MNINWFAIFSAFLMFTAGTVGQILGFENCTIQEVMVCSAFCICISLIGVT